MSRQAILSMPLSFAIVLVAAIALSGPARQAEMGLPAEPTGELPPVAEASKDVPSDALVEIDEPAPDPTSPPVPVEESLPVEPDAEPLDLTALPPAPASEPELPAESPPLESTTGRGREHWRPIAPGSSPPSSLISGG